MSYVSDEYHQPVQDSLNVYLTVHMLVIRVANRLVRSHGSVYTIRGRSRSLSIAYSVRLLNSKDPPCLGDVPRPAVISDLALRLQGVQRTHWIITRRCHPISMSWEYLQEQNKAMVSHSWECDAISYFNPAWWLEKDCLALPLFHPSPALLSCGQLLESGCPSYQWAPLHRKHTFRSIRSLPAWPTQLSRHI
jgi:hypothetical protein